MGIAIRTGHHCAQTVMKHYNIVGTARVSFGVYTSKEDIEKTYSGITDDMTHFAYFDKDGKIISSK